MYHEFFISHGVLLLPILAMLLFAGTFVAAVIHTVSRSRAAQYQELASAPLSDSETQVRHD
jgi:hypothetical protein